MSIHKCRIGISKAKKNDLSLLKLKIIPEQYTDFYKYLPVGDVDVDILYILPESSADEDMPIIENNFDENICDEANSTIIKHQKIMNNIQPLYLVHCFELDLKCYLSQRHLICNQVTLQKYE